MWRLSRSLQQKGFPRGQGGRQPGRLDAWQACSESGAAGSWEILRQSQAPPVDPTQGWLVLGQRLQALGVSELCPGNGRDSRVLATRQ